MSGLDGTLGSTLIGGVFATFLFGIGTLQTFNYYRIYPNGASLLRTTVAILWFLELGHSICVWHGIYQQTVTFYGQVQYLASPPTSLVISILFTSLVLALVQRHHSLSSSFFANRIRILSGRWYIQIIGTILMSLRLAFSIVLVVVTVTAPPGSGFSILDNRIHWTFTTVASLGPAVDILTALSLCYLLWRLGSGTRATGGETHTGNLVMRDTSHVFKITSWGERCSPQTPLLWPDGKFEIKFAVLQLRLRGLLFQHCV
ncbi:hypothetical protein C8R44DRAFT_695577 [Mycena epipterygia]|nr:hypothetical protein C8R44DRAFT_695577 [Mycena epipterygia]